MNLARPGREQPKLGRSALRGVRVRVKRLEWPGGNYASSLSDLPSVSQHSIRYPRSFAAEYERLNGEFQAVSSKLVGVVLDELWVDRPFP